MTLQTVATLEGGFGTDLAMAATGRWLAARPGTASVWDGDELVATTSVPAYREGMPRFSPDGATVHVGVEDLAAEDGERLETSRDLGWIVDGLDEEVDPTQFSPACVAMAGDGVRAAVLTAFLPTRDIDQRDSYGGPRSRLLVVDLAAGRVESVLVADADAQRPVMHASSTIVAAATTREVAAWGLDGEPLGCWSAGDIVDAVAVHPTADVVAALVGDGELLFHTATGHELGRSEGLPDPGAALAWDADGSRIAAVSRDGAVGVWTVSLDTASGSVEVSELGRAELDPDSGGGIVFGPGPDEVTVASDVVDQVITRLRIT